MAIIIPGGGAGEVGASFTPFIFNDGKEIAFDCGIRMSGFDSDIGLFKKEPDKTADAPMKTLPTFQSLPNLDVVQNIEDLLITHSHLDHTGAVPFLCLKNRKLKIYATTATKEFCKLHWLETAKFAAKRKIEPSFNFEDVQFALSRFRIITPSSNTSFSPIKLSDKHALIPINAGHTLGAVSYLITYKNEIIGFHSGDISYQRQRTVPGAPKFSLDGLKFIIVDSTYANETHPNRQKIEEQCVNAVRQAFESGKSVRFFVHAIGKVQEAYELAYEACPNAPIFIDGSGIQTSKVYLDHSAVNPAIAKCFVKSNRERKAIIKKGPNIVITPSAMKFGGFSRLYAEAGIPRSDHLFINLGYLDPHSPEYLFFESSRNNAVFQFGEKIIPRFCDAMRFRLPSHCDGNDILEMRERLKPDKTVMVHGDSSQTDAFISRHPNMGFIRAENGKAIEL